MMNLVAPLRFEEMMADSLKEVRLLRLPEQQQHPTPNPSPSPNPNPNPNPSPNSNPNL